MRSTMLLGLQAVTMALVACAEPGTDPNPPLTETNHRAVHFWESTASVYWLCVPFGQRPCGGAAEEAKVCAGARA